MSISVADNFKYQGTKPLDDRIKYATVADMKAVADAKLYDGCEAYCAETDKYYKFKSTNTVDETTGKWRERASGGTSDYSDLTNKPSIENVTLSGNKSASDLGLAKASDIPTDLSDLNDDSTHRLVTDTEKTTWNGKSAVSVTQVQSSGTKIATVNVNGTDTDLYAPSGGSGGGHTIEDSEGTDLTQRDTLQFGEGFLAEDDSTNEKTVITPDVMQSGDIDDVLTPLPSVQPQYPRYSTSERVIGYWIDGKPLYERVFNPTISSNNQTFVTVATIPSLDTLAFVQALAGNNGEWELESSAYTENNDIKAKHGWTAATVSIDWVVTARYTKTTDG